MKGPFFVFLILLPGFILLILLILLAMQYKQLRALVSPEPMRMAPVASTPESRARVLAALDSFLVAGRTSRENARDTLALDAADLNDLARASAAKEKFHVDYHLALEDTLLVARSSMPVERLQGFLASFAKIFRVRGYLNSEMKGYPLLDGGELYVVPVAAVMNGVAAPPSVLSSKGKIEAGEWAADKAAFDRAVKMLSGVEIRDGRMWLMR